MKLKDLIEGFAGEIEQAHDRLECDLDRLATLDLTDPAYMDVLEQYSGQAQRMGEAAELAGFPGLQLVCAHVVENSLMLAIQSPAERSPLLAFLRAWPPLMVYYLRNLSDPSAAAGLIDHLVGAPMPMDAEQAMKVMHMLGAMPLQVGLAGDAEGQPSRPILATPDDVALVLPDDVDRSFLEGFFQEAPNQARQLVELARLMAAGEIGSEAIVAAKRVAHTLKGSGATTGLRGIASLGHHLEDILDYFERDGSKVTRPVASTVLDAAYCIEQMIGFVAGEDDYPQQAQGMLQTVLDLANRIDRGESLEVAMARGVPEAPAEVTSPAPLADPDARDAPHSGLAKPRNDAATGAAGSPAAALRVSLQRIEDLFLVSSELSVNNAAMETHIKNLVESARDLVAQNFRVQKRLSELETVLEVRTPTMMHSRSRLGSDTEFDPLEMDQYNELHSTSHALAEEAADARALAARVEEGIAVLGTHHSRQQRLNDELQHLVIGTRMTEVGVLESRLQRNVRSTCQVTGKEAVLVLEGGDTLIDSNLLNRLAEPLLHLLRNAVDHGIETPQERAAAGKPAVGRIHLSFARQGQQVVLRCRDDGRGLDPRAIRQRALARGMITADQALSDAEVARLITLPGFSTREAVSEVSGRGIGLDVVREWVREMKGTIQIASKPGTGCTFDLRFAASLSTMQALIVEVAGERFALPSVQVQQAIARAVGAFENVEDELIYRLGKQSYPAMRLADVAGVPDSPKPLDAYSAVIINVDDEARVLAVDRLVDARELVVNKPGRYARHLRGVAGLSVLGDGAIAVNLDVAQLLAGGARAMLASDVVASGSRQSELPGVLIVDDSLSVRNSLVQLLRDAGYRAETARDGIDAIETLATFKPDVVVTDLEMPNMNGVELTYHIRGREDIAATPVIMITSRSQDKHRRMAEQAGVNTYITKPYSDGELLKMIRSTIIH